MVFPVRVLTKVSDGQGQASVSQGPEPWAYTKYEFRYLAIIDQLYTVDSPIIHIPSGKAPGYGFLESMGFRISGEQQL